LAWATLYRRVFDIAPLECSSCGGRLRFVEVIEYWLDCAGKVDVPVGLARLRRLSDELEARPARDGMHRLLIDFRHTVWRAKMHIESYPESRATRLV
jgi:hypothetical protein